MTIWLFNPPEPTGQPTLHPIDESLDLFTRGRCGNCAACPKVWRLVVPTASGNPLSENYGGVFYLNRQPYTARSSGDPLSGLCLWSSLPALPIPDANPYDGDFSEGWTLAFDFFTPVNGYRWILYTPKYSDGIGSYQSVYVQQGTIWGCLQANSLGLYDVVGDAAFPYTPAVLTVTPHPA